MEFEEAGMAGMRTRSGTPASGETICCEVEVHYCLAEEQGKRQVDESNMVHCTNIHGRWYS